MSDVRYQIILNLFNEWNELFRVLPPDVKSAFYDRLYSHEG